MDQYKIYLFSDISRLKDPNWMNIINITNVLILNNSIFKRDYPIWINDNLYFVYFDKSPFDKSIISESDITRADIKYKLPEQDSREYKLLVEFYNVYKSINSEVNECCFKLKSIINSNDWF